MSKKNNDKGPADGLPVGTPPEAEPSALPVKRSARLIVSRVLIYTGLALILFAAGYELYNYPWHNWGVEDKDEWHDPDYMADPAPPEEDMVFATPEPTPQGDIDLFVPDGVTERPDIEMPGMEDAILNISGNRNYRGVYLGIMKIPRLNLSQWILKGSSQSELRLGLGFVTETGEIGGKANCAIAGHRSTAVMHPFRYLDIMKPGDDIFITYNDVVYTYTALDEVFVVEEREVWVLDDIPDTPYALTLITCHPYGNRTHRLILRAQLTAIDGVAFDANNG